MNQEIESIDLSPALIRIVSKSDAGTEEVYIVPKFITKFSRNKLADKSWILRIQVGGEMTPSLFTTTDKSIAKQFAELAEILLDAQK